jgi:hypothetical protein
VVGQVLLCVPNRLCEIAVARLVKAREEHERVAVA